MASKSTHLAAASRHFLSSVPHSQQVAGRVKVEVDAHWVDCRWFASNMTPVPHARLLTLLFFLFRFGDHPFLDYHRVDPDVLDHPI